MSCWLLLPSALAQETVRVASYNLHVFDSTVQADGDRLDKMRQVIERLDADVIGLQEVSDRTALRLLFPADQWVVLMDDQSSQSFDIDLAVAVRLPFSIRNAITNDVDADDEDFLFPSSQDNDLFPARRDVLVAEITPPDSMESFFVMVHHGKSRRGGRAATDATRENASRRLLTTLQQDYPDTPFILLGDFNDNPDDRSLNILETGNPDALGGAEEIQGPFLINLMEPLVVAGHVSFGRKSNDVVGEMLNTLDPGSRARNNDARGTNLNTGDILFDQMLIPAWMVSRYVGGSAQVFNFAVGASGNETTRASDHLPVFAEFELVAASPEEPSSPPATHRIHSLLPNPDGDDNRREEVTIENLSNTLLNLSNWQLRDAGNNTFTLSGAIPPQSRLTIVMTANTMPLNNTGDTVFLVNPSGTTIHQFSYSSAEAQSGVTIIR